MYFKVLPEEYMRVIFCDSVSTQCIGNIVMMQKRGQTAGSEYASRLSKADDRTWRRLGISIKSFRR